MNACILGDAVCEWQASTRDLHGAWPSSSRSGLENKLNARRKNWRRELPKFGNWGSINLHCAHAKLPLLLSSERLRR